MSKEKQSEGPKRKDYKYALVKKNDPIELLADKLIGANSHLSHLNENDVKIGFEWVYDVKPDVDGNRHVIKVAKVPETYFHLTGLHFLLLVDKDRWTAPEFTDRQRNAEMLQALVQCQTRSDTNGETQLYTDGKPVCRKRKLATFSPEAIAQFGNFSDQAHQMMVCCEKARQKKLFDEPEPTAEEAHQEAVAA